MLVWEHGTTMFDVWERMSSGFTRLLALYTETLFSFGLFGRALKLYFDASDAAGLVVRACPILVLI
jgi:hypothetical protein